MWCLLQGSIESQILSAVMVSRLDDICELISSSEVNEVLGLENPSNRRWHKSLGHLSDSVRYQLCRNLLFS